MTAEPRSILNETGEQVGHFDRIELVRGRLQVTGWAFANRASLFLGGACCDASVSQHRPDVAEHLKCGEAVGFELSVPGSRRVIETSDAPGVTFAVQPGRPAIAPVSLPLRIDRRAQRRLKLRFLRDLALAVPALIGWRLTRKPVYRARVKSRLSLTRPPVFRPMESRLFQAEGDTPPPALDRRISIVLPVYNAFDILQICLAQVERHTDLPFRLILIEDNSPDERVRPFLRDWVAQRPFAELIENPQNLGFIGSVNRGFARALRHRGPDEGPVVLLNSDALVPQGWASRLVRPFYNHSDIASVTPLSNDAEIMSVPVICQRSDLRAGQAEAMDAVAARFAPEALLSVVPTGVGFCMALGRDWLERAGPFDTQFGRGYGEEVDWCQKVARLGGRHLALPGLFVEHRGGESFGSATKAALIAQNNRVIARRYPEYDATVQDFIGADPLLTARLALGLAWAGSLNPLRHVPVYLAHSLGGGADIYLEHRIQGDLQRGQPSVVLRVGGTRRWQVELVAPAGRTSGQTDDFALVRQLLDGLPQRQVVYSCGVGDPEPAELPELLLSLLREQDRAELLFHDYYPLSPSYTLLDSDGVYRGPVKPPRSDRAHSLRRGDGSPLELADWQAAWRRFAARARLVVFSPDSERQVRSVWPDLARNIVLRPHRLHKQIGRVRPLASDAPTVIGVLGNIGRQKGAGVLRDLARLLDEQPMPPRLVLVGNIDPAYSLPGSVHLHGSYDVADLPVLAECHAITHWLIPSIWPETFCYTVHEALSTGLPVIAFDIGAQGDAVRAAPNGIPVPFDSGRKLAERLMALFVTPIPSRERRATERAI